MRIPEPVAYILLGGIFTGYFLLEEFFTATAALIIAGICYVAGASFIFTQLFALAFHPDKYPELQEPSIVWRTKIFSLLIILTPPSRKLF